MFLLVSACVCWTVKSQCVCVCVCLRQASEVKAIIASDRSTLFANGVTLAGRKCTVLRDALNVDGQNTMDIKMKTSEKEPDPFSFTIGRAHKGESQQIKTKNMSSVCSLRESTSAELE